MSKHRVVADSRRRITLPSGVANPGDTFEMRVLPTGQIELKPVCLIPKNLELRQKTVRIIQSRSTP